MTAIVNNARYSRNRGGNFQRSFLSWHISHCLSVSDNYCPQSERQLWTFFSFFFFFALLKLMWLQRESGDWDWSPLNGRRWSSSFFLSEEKVSGKKRVKNQNGNDICHQRRPALCQPFTLQGERSALQIGRALASFTSGQAGRGTVPTHNPSVIRPR